MTGGGRPSLGRSGRTVPGSTKLTAIEAEILKARHGTIHSGLRAALDAYLTDVGSKPHKVKATKATKKVSPIVLEVPAAVPPVEAPARCRVHRNYRVINRWVDRGQQWTTKRCEDCGFELTALDHG